MVRVPTPRALARARFTADLLDVARARLATDGAAGLSLRAIARDLGVASSAVYRYVESRDTLLTMLVVEGFDAVGEACEAADAAARAADEPPGRRLLAVARAFRGWATANPHLFALVYGTPVPGYAAPEDTVEHALRVWRVLIGVVVDAAARGDLHPGRPRPASSGLAGEAALALGRRVAAEHGADGVTVGDTEVAHVVTIFAAVVGAVGAELFGHLRGVGDDPAGVLDAVVATVAAGVGLRVDPA